MYEFLFIELSLVILWFITNQENTQGMFDIHLVFTDEIHTLILESVKDIYSFRLSVDCTDSLIVFYSFGVLCFSILFFTINEKTDDKMNAYNSELITTEQIQNDLFFFDILYWFLLCILLYIILDISIPVSNTYVSIWISFVYTAFLFQCCNIANMGTLFRGISLSLWGIQALMILLITNISVFNGSCILWFNLIGFIFYYVNVVEGDLVYTKFIHARLYACVLYNICFIFIYLNNTRQLIDGKK